MKIVKKVLGVLLVGMLATGTLIGCNANKQPPSAESKPQTTEVAESEASKSAESETSTVDWPKSAIQILLPSKAGGITDLHTRFLQNWWQKSLDTSMAVVNYDNETVAYENTRSAKTDGYTLMTQHSTIIAKYLTGAIDFDPSTELTVIAKLQYMGSQAMIAAPDAPYDTFVEMVEYAKGHPGELSAGISTNGTTHFIWGSVMKEAGIDLKLVEAASETDKLTNVAGGFISLGNVSLASAAQYEEAGKVKVLGILGAKDDDTSDFPQWTNIVDQGVNVSWNSDIYLFGPKDMDAALVETINASLKDVVNDEEFVANMKTLGGAALWRGVEESQVAFKMDMEKLSDIATSLGINIR